jgi:hypothetical protein
MGSQEHLKLFYARLFLIDMNNILVPLIKAKAKPKTKEPQGHREKLSVYLVVLPH